MSADPAKPWIGKNGKVKPAARHKARYFAVQGLYQWQLADSNISDIEAQFRADNDSKRIDWDYFHEILVGISRQRSDLLAELGPYIDRQADDLDPIEKAILLIATFEFKQRIDIPYKVVINEAVELAKTFGATDGHKYVNGVLDKLAPKLRALETNAK